MKCTVSICDRDAEKRGLCGGHYRRLQRSGDVQEKVPLRAVAAKGEPEQWLLSHVAFEGSECLIWPFYAKADGYGVIRHNGKTSNASALMCELAHGPKPTDQHEAAHSCGRGQFGCVHPGHVRWATHQENGQDAVLHGSFPNGEKHWSTVHSDCLIEDVRKALRAGMLHRQIEAKFGISKGYISLIRNGKRRAIPSVTVKEQRLAV